MDPSVARNGVKRSTVGVIGLTGLVTRIGQEPRESEQEVGDDGDELNP